MPYTKSEDIAKYCKEIEETAEDPEEAGMAMDWIMSAAQYHNHKLKKKAKIGETVDIDYVINQEVEKHEETDRK